VFLAVLAERFFGFDLGRRQWIGLVITAAGLVVVGLTSGKHPGGGSALAALIGVECGVLVGGSLLVLASVKFDNTHRNEGMMLAVGAGALFGVSDVAIKYLTRAAHGGVLALVSPWLLAALVAMVVAFYASARSLQLGPGLEVIALTSVAANVVAISGGILVFHDPIGSGPTQIVERLLAFCFVIVGAGLMPAPPRARRGRRTAKIRRHGAGRSASHSRPGHETPSPANAQPTPADATVSAANRSSGGASQDPA
jgi:drug/metabolite transporter (DMT)-like permease